MTIIYGYDDESEIPEADRHHYRQVDGRWIASIQGDPNTERIREFRTNNIELLRQRDEQNSRIASLESELNALRASAAGTAGGGTPVAAGSASSPGSASPGATPSGGAPASPPPPGGSALGQDAPRDNGADLDRLVAERTQAMEQRLMGEINQLRTERDTALAAADRERVTNEVSRIGAQLGIEPVLMQDFVNRALGVFSYEDGGFVGRDGDRILYSADKPTERMGIEEWGRALPRPFFAPSSGAAAPGNQAPGNGVPVVARGDDQAFLANLGEIASGKVTVQ